MRAGVFLLTARRAFIWRGLMGMLRVAAALPRAWRSREARRRRNSRSSTSRPMFFSNAPASFRKTFSPGPRWSTPRRAARPGGDTATGVMIDFTFAGDRNFAPKYAVRHRRPDPDQPRRPAGRHPQGVHRLPLRRRRRRAQGGLPRERHLRAADDRRPRRQDREAGAARLLLHGSAGVELSPPAQ